MHWRIQGCIDLILFQRVLEIKDNMFTSQLYFISFVGLFEMHILLPLTLLAHMMMMMMMMMMVTTMMMIFSLKVSGSCLLLLTHRHLQLGPGAPGKKREFTEIVFEF